MKTTYTEPQNNLINFKNVWFCGRVGGAGLGGGGGGLVIPYIFLLSP